MDVGLTDLIRQGERLRERLAGMIESISPRVSEDYRFLFDYGVWVKGVDTFLRKNKIRSPWRLFPSKVPSTISRIEYDDGVGYKSAEVPISGGVAYNTAIPREMQKATDLINTLDEQIDFLKSKLPQARDSLSRKKMLRSIDLVVKSFGTPYPIFIVLDGRFDTPIRPTRKNQSVQRLFNLAYVADAPHTRVKYSKNTADGINSGLFKLKGIKDYLTSNGFHKPTLAQKENDILVLKNEVSVSVKLLQDVPQQYRHQYVDKTK